MESKDLELIQQDLKKQLDIDWFLDQEKSLCVIDEDTAKQALSMALQSRMLEKKIEKSRAEIVRPHLDFQRAINKLVKDFKDNLETLEKRLQGKIDKWMEEQREYHFTTTNSIRVDEGVIYTKKEWDFCVQDEQIVPREYLCVDPDAIEKAIKNGTRKIPGVKIFEVEKTHMRIKESL
jgi:hypothetical protein